MFTYYLVITHTHMHTHLSLLNEEKAKIAQNKVDGWIYR